MNFLSLFSGIGGMDLGLERAGMRCVAQVEIDPFCRCVLTKHWPHVPRFEDVRQVNRETFAPLGPIDLIAGGFPCQDISIANPVAKGLDGERSGLWSDFARIVRVLAPRFVLVENTPALLIRGFDRVLGDLASTGFDAEWAVLPAAALGADHLRDRLFIIAYSQCKGREGNERRILASAEPFTRHLTRRDCGGGRYPARSLHRCVARCGRKRDGVPRWMERLEGLGNAVYPPVAEWIGRRIVEAASA